MAELFRYIEQVFVVPRATSTIDVERESDLQSSLRTALSEQLSSEKIRGIADRFIAKHFPFPWADPLHLGKNLLAARHQLLEMVSPDRHAIDKLFTNIMGNNIHSVVGSSDFTSDKALLDDTLVSVKIVTGFNKVNAQNLVAVRQTIAFLEDFDAGSVQDYTVEAILSSLRRPIRIPQAFVRPLVLAPAPTPPAQPPDAATQAAARQRTQLMAEQENLKTAYHMIMDLQPNQFELKPSGIKADRPVAKVQKAGKVTAKGEKPSSVDDSLSARASVLTVPQQVIEQFGNDVRKALEKASIDASSASVVHVIAAIKKQWQDVSERLAPYQVPAPARVFRVGVHLFTVPDSNATTVPSNKEGL